MKNLLKGFVETVSCGHVMIADGMALMSVVVMAVKKNSTHG
jgi:hypothetical protein